MEYRQEPSSETVLKRGRNKRTALVLAAVLLPTSLGVGAVLDGGKTPVAMAAAARSAAAILAQRTPGLRGSGPLNQTKPHPPAAAQTSSLPPDNPPVYPPAFGLVERNDEPMPLNDLEIAPPAGAVDLLPPDNAVITPLSEGVPNPKPEPLPPGGGVPPYFTPPGGGGGGGGFPPSPPPGGEIPAVPEPATWAMMIIGMAMVGAGLRLRRRQATELADA